MKQDRFFWIILSIIALLALTAVGLFLLRQQRQAYGAEDTPQGVLYNYLLALEKGDYTRAYRYLHSAAGKPDLERFRQAFLTRQLDLSNVAVQIGEAYPSDDQVVVSLVLIRSGGGPFGEVYRENASAWMTRDSQGEWKIVNMPYPYWGWDWYTTPPAPVIP
jgi:hypothetical protein